MAKRKRDPGLIRVSVDGNSYTLDMLGSTTKDRLELYRQSGLTLPQVAQAIDNGQQETFFLAALVFLARRQMGQPAGFMAIADAITWDSDIEMEIVGDSAAGDSAEDDAPKEPETSTPV